MTDDWKRGVDLLEFIREGIPSNAIGSDFDDITVEEKDGGLKITFTYIDAGKLRPEAREALSRLTKTDSRGPL